MERNERLVAIGSRIREKMVSEGHTITSLAERSGMTKSTLGRILQGEGQSLDIAAHERIAVSLGVSFTDLIAIEKPLFPKLLGVKAIDQLLWQFYGLLYGGVKSLKTIEALVTDQYYLSYLQEDYPISRPRNHLTLAEEIKENERTVQEQGVIAVEPTQAWIAGKGKILCYTRTLSAFNAQSGSQPPNNMDVHQTNTIDLIKLSDHIDTPNLNTFKIARRAIAVTQSVSRIG